MDPEFPLLLGSHEMSPGVTDILLDCPVSRGTTGSTPPLALPLSERELKVESSLP